MPERCWSELRLTRVPRLLRVTLGGMYITRPSVKVGRYRMIKHKLDKGNDVNPKRYVKPVHVFGFTCRGQGCRLSR